MRFEDARVIEGMLLKRGMGNGKWKIEMGGKRGQRSFVVTFEHDLKLRFFFDGRMWVSVQIGQLNMEGKSILYVFLFLVFESRKVHNGKKPIDLNAEKVTKVTLWMQTGISSFFCPDYQFVLVRPECD